MDRIKWIVLILAIVTVKPVHAQQVIFPGAEGDELLDLLRQNYTPTLTLPWNQVRDTMFSQVDKINDSVECVYTGHKLFLPPNEDPTEFLFMNGGPTGLNTEHVYPKSKGAFEFSAAHSDMHNLRASRVPVNTDRGSYPFGEIDDANTERWYYLLEEMNSIPGSNIDAYSEWSQIPDDRFEPRESVKGDIARTVLYFYSIYTIQANSADPEFFQLQVEDVCNWHYEDPVTDQELMRSQKIAGYQGNENPYVLDCTLAARTYCGEWEQECLTSVQDIVSNAPFKWKAYFDGADILIEIEGDTGFEADIALYQMSGLNLGNYTFDIQPGTQQLRLQTHSYLPSGIYAIRLMWNSAGKTGIASTKVFVAN